LTSPGPIRVKGYSPVINLGRCRVWHLCVNNDTEFLTLQSQGWHREFWHRGVHNDTELPTEQSREWHRVNAAEIYSAFP
jgi:hypothetical protein